MLNKMFNIIMIFLVFIIILLFIIDNLVDNNINNNNYDKEKMLAIAEDIERVKKEKEERDKKESNKNLEINEIAAKIDKEFNNELKNKGYLYASYSISKGVDPYLAAAISLEETGCKWNCSSLVKNCHNVGGMKGSGCGEYGYFNDLDSGIKAFIDNIYNNYVLYGLTTADTMNSKYAENPLWARNVNNYINKIKSN